jgi:uncharacterized paraquat-inducible protein A
MIVSCPSCDARHQLPQGMAAARRITCRACGHQWRDTLTFDAIDVTAARRRR